jgi:succinate dehydrogenase/fumarate reductase flavoprotein subunit
MNNLNVHVLFDLSATHSFIARIIFTKLGMRVEVIEKGFVIRTQTNNMYVRVGVSLASYETKVDLIPLELHNFDIILGMDWLSK